MTSACLLCCGKLALRMCWIAGPSSPPQPSLPTMPTYLQEITAAEEAADHSTSPASAPAVAPTTPAPQPSISTTAPTSAASEGTQSVSTTPAMSAPPAPSA